MIYVLRNGALKETVVKIGRTSRSSEERSSELSKPTRVAEPFEVLYKGTIGVREHVVRFQLNPCATNKIAACA